MEPIAETARAAEELRRLDSDADIVERLTVLAAQAQEVVPDLVGVSIGRLDHGLTFTLVASAIEVALLDGIQYVAGGPCVEGARHHEALELEEADVLDEERWRLFAEASAAQAVRSTLTLPVISGGDVVGTVNLYAASPRAFGGHHEAMAAIFGAEASAAMENTDLSFRTRREAEAAPERLRARAHIDVAVGLLMVQLDVGPERAEEVLRDAAARAGVSTEALAEQIARARRRRDGEDG